MLILRKNRSPAGRKQAGSPQRISELGQNRRSQAGLRIQLMLQELIVLFLCVLLSPPDKDQLLEIAKANAAAMCAKAGMPIPASLRSTALPMALPSMATSAAMASMTAGTLHCHNPKSYQEYLFLVKTSHV